MQASLTISTLSKSRRAEEPQKIAFFPAFMCVAVVCLLGLPIAGCGGVTVQKEQVLRNGAKHLDCDPAGVKIVDDKPLEKTVSGCGRKLTYVRRCGGDTCHWIPQKPTNN